MRIYAYLRVDPNMETQANINTYTNYLYKHGYVVKSSRIIVEEATADTSICYRDKIMNLIKYALEERDVLIIRSLDSMGSNFSEMHMFIGILEAKKIRLICLDYSKNEIKDDLKMFFFHFIKMCYEFESKFKNKKNALLNNNIIKKVGRPEKLNSEQKRQVIEKFKCGTSVYALAKEYAVTRTVIQRILNQYSESLN